MLANARKTLSRSAKTPEGATTRSKAVPNKNNKSILKGKTSVEDEPEESEDEEPEAAEEELPTQKDRDPAVKQVPTTAVPRSVQKRVEFEVLPEGGLPMRAKPTKSGMIPFVDIPPMNPALRQKKPVATESEPIPAIDKKGPAYKHRAPIEDDANWSGFIKTLRDLPVTISQGQLMGLINAQSRKRVIEELTAKRIPVDEDKPVKRGATMVEEIEEMLDDDGNAYEQLAFTELPEPTYTILGEDEGELKAGSIIASDPVTQYLNGLAPEEAARKIMVARESYLLKTLYPLVNAQAEVESIIDGGSQIISMSADVAIQVGATWDPDVTIQMQSANKQLEKTQGLVRNMPFRFGDEITVYFQVHVMQNVAYDVLLGRPFEVLTASVFENALDGSQMVTLTEPNSGKRCKMPTYDRGKPRKVITRKHPETVESF